jgi:RNA polymerase sigma-70 factor (ECF subfamily)
MSDDLDVRHLVALAKTGDARAFGALYDRYAERIYRFALVRLGEPADAEDLLQRVFVKVIEALPRYEDRGLPFAAWLFRIARNALIDIERARPSVASLDSAVHWPDGVDQPARLAELAADREAVRAALHALTAEQREVVIYRFFGDLTTREIGQLMGKREGSVRALQFRALATMRRRLEGDQWAGANILEEPA